MKRTFFLLIFAVAICSTSKSQHCGWDFSYVIMLDVRDSFTNKTINDLYIILTDSAGRPYTSKWNLKNFKKTPIYQYTDTLKFGQNPASNYIKYRSYDIPFGEGNYMLLVSHNLYPGFNKNGSDQIYIADKNGRYESVSVTFDKNKIVSMCTKIHVLRKREKRDEATIKVMLRRKTLVQAQFSPQTQTRGLDRNS